MIPCAARRAPSGAGRTLRSPSGIATASPVPTTALSPGSSSCRARTRRDRGPRHRCTRARAGSPRRAGGGSGARSRARLRGASDSRGSTIRYGAKRRTLRCGSRRARTKTPSGRSARSSTGAPERVQLGEARTLVVRNRAVAPARTARRSARRSGVAARPRPSPVRAETWSASGKRLLRRRRRSGSAASILFNTSSTGSSPAPISPSTASTAASISSSSVVGGRGIGHVQHEVGDERLLERRREPLDQLVREAADETRRCRSRGSGVPPRSKRARRSGRASRRAGR